MFCAYHLDPMYGTLPGKQQKLMRLRRQEKRSKPSFKTVPQGLEATDSLPHLILAYSLKETFLCILPVPTFLGFGELTAHTTSSTALCNQYFHCGYFTAQKVYACLEAVFNAEHRDKSKSL